MSKILLLSDTHRDDEKFERIYQLHQDIPLKIHCGDICMPSDAPLAKPFLITKGNHDYEYDYPEYLIYDHYFITHGHTFYVYETFDLMIQKAKENHCDTIIHGHTHIPYDQVIDGIRIINPGSVLINRGSYGYGTYAILDEDTQQLTFYHHETDEDVTQEVIEDGLLTLLDIREFTKKMNISRIA